MTMASARRPIFEGGPFGGWLCSRSGGTDWDFFPFGRWGRGYRVSEDEIARLRRLERLAMTLAFVVALAAAFMLGALLRRPASAYATGCACFVAALAAKASFNAAAAWLLRRAPAAEQAADAGRVAC